MKRTAYLSPVLWRDGRTNTCRARLRLCHRPQFTDGSEIGRVGDLNPQSPKKSKIGLRIIATPGRFRRISSCVRRRATVRSSGSSQAKGMIKRAAPRTMALSARARARSRDADVPPAHHDGLSTSPAVSAEPGALICTVENRQGGYYKSIISSLCAFAVYGDGKIYLGP